MIPKNPTTFFVFWFFFLPLKKFNSGMRNEKDSPSMPGADRKKQNKKKTQKKKQTVQKKKKKKN